MSTTGETSLPTAGEPGHGERFVLVVAYHRHPAAPAATTADPREHSINGVISSLLGAFADGRRGCWVGWVEAVSRRPSGFSCHLPIDDVRFPNLVASRIPLTGEDIRSFHTAFCRHGLWPTLHSDPGRASFDGAGWDRFVDVNQAFAERIAIEAALGATVVAHDYSLWLVPGLLRRLRPDLAIGFFHHTPFPAPECFGIIPGGQQILSSLLEADFVGFQAAGDLLNFVDTLETRATTETVGDLPGLLDDERSHARGAIPAAVRVDHRTVRLGIHPVAVDVAYIDDVLRDPATRRRIAADREPSGGPHRVVSIGRLEHSKGFVQQLGAFGALLERDPALRGKVALTMVCTPDGTGAPRYQALGRELQRLAGRINERFGAPGYAPVRLDRRRLPKAELVALLANADIGWFTPLRDGMNLIAKEFVAVKTGLQTPGVLVLSRYAGAAPQLRSALLTDPHDPEAMVASLARALELDQESQRLQMAQLGRIVRGSDVTRWSSDLLAAISAGVRRDKGNRAGADKEDGNGLESRR